MARINRAGRPPIFSLEDALIYRPASARSNTDSVPWHNLECSAGFQPATSRQESVTPPAPRSVADRLAGKNLGCAQASKQVLRLACLTRSQRCSDFQPLSRRAVVEAVPSRPPNPQLLIPNPVSRSRVLSSSIRERVMNSCPKFEFVSLPAPPGTSTWEMPGRRFSTGCSRGITTERLSCASKTPMPSVRSRNTRGN